MSFDARDRREKFSINRCTRSIAHRSANPTMPHRTSRSRWEKRLKLITFGVNDRFAVDGTIDCSLDTIKARPFFCRFVSFAYYFFLFAMLTLRRDVDDEKDYGVEKDYSLFEGRERRIMS